MHSIDERAKIRPLVKNDKDTVKLILENSQMFRSEEVDVALEVIDEYLIDPERSDYRTYVYVEDNDKVVGFIIYGPNPMTVGTYDLYWIVVDDRHQRKMIGSHLIAFAENKVREDGGRLLIAETSSKPVYLRTRNFYKQKGYSEVAQIRDYYDIGDDLIIYGKYLKEA